MENMAFVVSCNTSMRRGGDQFMEVGSKIIDWRGHVLSAVEQGTEGRCTGLVDIEGLRRRRAQRDLTYSTRGPNYLTRMRVEAFRPLYNAASLFPPNQYEPAADEVVDPSTSGHLLSTALQNMERMGIPLDENERNA
jgi:hypothetical protein